MSRVVAKLSLIVVALLAPLSAVHAAVVISEVAWMGTRADTGAFCEWVELANTEASPVSLSGWKLFTGDGGMNVPLSGSINANGYFLIAWKTEKNCPDPVPGVTEDITHTFGNGLADKGEVLILASDLSEVDKIDATEGWEKSIGGSSTKKLTPQRIGDGWTTAEPTPRAANISADTSTSGDTPTTPTSDPQTPQPSVAGVTVVTGKRTSPVPVLYIEAGSGKIVTRGASAVFRAYAYDSNNELRKDAKFDWSFGDGSGGEGTEVAHTYVLSGTYTIVIHAKAGPSEAVSTLSVRVDDSKVEVITSDETSVTLKNNGAEMVDLSSWYLAQGERKFTFPPYTVLVAGQEAHFPQAITGLGSSTLPVHLLFPDGSSVSELVRATSTPATVDAPAQETLMVPVVQPISFEAGIQGIEAALPQIDTNASSTYEETRAPSAPVNPGVLGASVANSMPSFLKSPWTASFLGLLVAAGAVLVVL